LGERSGGVKGTSPPPHPPFFFQIIPTAVEKPLPSTTSSLPFPESFDNFYYERENEFTVSALRSIILNPSHYRIAVIFAPAGMGKTHLLKACANESLNLGEKAVYISSLRILEELISAYRERRKPNFEFLRGSKVILIDDIHILKGRGFALEFLARLMDKVESSGKILIMAGQGNPSQFSDSPSFKTRLMSALKLGINPPSRKVREKIFISACKRLGIDPPRRLRDFVVENVINPRGIIGSANRLGAYFEVFRSFPDDPSEILGDLVEMEDPFKLFGRGKVGKYLTAYYLKMKGKSVEEIAGILNCSRASVYNYIKRAKEILQKDEKLREKMEGRKLL